MRHLQGGRDHTAHATLSGRGGAQVWSRRGAVAAEQHHHTPPSHGALATSAATDLASRIQVVALFWVACPIVARPICGLPRTMGRYPRALAQFCPAQPISLPKIRASLACRYTCTPRAVISHKMQSRRRSGAQTVSQSAQNECQSTYRRTRASSHLQLVGAFGCTRYHAPSSAAARTGCKRVLIWALCFRRRIR